MYTVLVSELGKQDFFFFYFYLDTERKIKGKYSLLRQYNLDY